MPTEINLDEIDWSRFSKATIRHVERVMDIKPPPIQPTTAVGVVEATMTPEQLIDCRRRKASRECFLRPKRRE